MVIDVTKCDGCYNCFIACKDEYCGTGHPGYSAPQPMTGQDWMRIVLKERGQFPKVKQDYIAMPCLQCDDPACIRNSPDGAVYKRKDGIVIIDPDRANGNRDIVNSCPYRLIHWNEEEHVAQKCTMCAHLLDAGWKEPRCVEACPTGTLIFGDLDDPNSAVSKALAAGATEVPHPEYGLKEKVRFIGLPKNFVAGTVVLADTDECGAGATITLETTGSEGGAAAKLTTTADAFGDFEFEGLPDNTSYKLTVSASGYKPHKQDVKTTKSFYLGEITLKK
jgi:Fe-S-cluster-containing dehydrogenase component